MKILRYSTQYKKDFKRYRNNPVKLIKLLEVLRLLEAEVELPFLKKKLTKSLWILFGLRICIVWQIPVSFH